jgi:2-keto-4-pentenoate hydratase/2-oxohepta-3-ene-1,7-dioic acid hydratase in catechol pathway
MSMNFPLLTFDHDGSPRAGVLLEDRVHDVAELTGRPGWASVLQILQQWDTAQADIATAAKRPPVPGLLLSSVKLLAPVLYPGAVFCAGANYRDHVAEMFKAQGLPMGPTMQDRGDTPWHFLKTPRASIVGPGVDVKRPPGSECLDWEIELVAVIGKEARNVSAANALKYVAGYTIANDLSARDLTKRDKQDPKSPFYYDWIGQKCFDGACPIGPWIVPASAIPNPHKLALKLWVGEELMQDSNTEQLIFDIPEQIAALSARVTLFPGDLVLTGTPAGVGMGRKRFLQSGETVRLAIEGIGEFSHRIA